MNECEEIKWQDRMTAFIIAMVVLSAAAAMIGIWKKETVVNEIETLDIDDIIITDKGPLPEIEFEAEILPEILPPLFDEPLPPLQGEV